MSLFGVTDHFHDLVYCDDGDMGEEGGFNFRVVGHAHGSYCGIEYGTCFILYALERSLLQAFMI